jgi:hypothetical protein
MAVRGTVVLLATLTLGACGGATHPNATTRPSTPTTEPPPTTTTTTPPPPTQTTPKPKPPPPTPRRRHAPRAAPSGPETVKTVTGDGNVLVLDNGDVYSVSDSASG